MMSRTTKLSYAWLLLCIVALGCSRKSDETGMRPAAYQNDGTAASPIGEDVATAPPEWTPGDHGEAIADAPPSGGDAMEETPRYPTGEARPRMMAPHDEVYTSPAEDPGFAMAEPPDEGPHDAMAEPPAADVPSAAPMAAATDVTPGAVRTPAAARINAGAAPEVEEDYQVVEVFYGTDRARLAPATLDARDYLRHYRGALGMLAATLVLAGSLVLGQKRKLAMGAGVAGAVLAVGFGLSASAKAVNSRHVSADDILKYSDGRGVLELGVAEVSIPKDHRTGELESPSVLRLEFSEDPAKHVMILKSRAVRNDEFHRLLRDSVNSAPRRELLVFIHGYRVSFDEALRRTAQIAADVRFPGTAVCYSWPSSGALLAYVADENNVEWTVPHFKEFLTQLREQSGADAINLVGHSMGTRALGDALREFARELGQEQKPFNQVVLAAPDIDAEVFRRDIVPALTRTAHRVTLYASSNDQALMASRKLHAYPRAGESGANLVVVPGLDTIDVSAIDTSLLGHSYYGDNDSIIADLYHLVHDALPPSQRDRLQAAALNGLPYWVFTAAARVATPGGVRVMQ